MKAMPLPVVPCEKGWGSSPLSAGTIPWGRAVPTPCKLRNKRQVPSPIENFKLLVVPIPLLVTRGRGSRLSCVAGYEQVVPRKRHRQISALSMETVSAIRVRELECMNKTLVVVPTYNERENLPPLAQRLMSLTVPVDLLVVDDNSPDGTGKIAEELALKRASIHVLHREQKSGLGRAYIAGFKWALEHGYEFVFELDGDFSHNPDDIPMFLEAAANSDLVLGSRYLNGIRVINSPLSRLMLSKSAAKHVKLITGLPFTDPTGGYKCFRRRPLEAMHLQ